MAPLSPTSYIVLGLLEQVGEGTPYELKKLAESFSDLWALRHDQVYREPERLAQQGLLKERREQEGRRRRRFSLTKAGQQALDQWRKTPTTEFTELRDAGLLQLLFGAEPEPLAQTHLQLHQQKLAEYEQFASTIGRDAPLPLRRALNSGIGHEREWVRYWTAILAGGDGA